MHRNLKMTIMYDGSNYAGWQRLDNDNRKNTIQGVLEENLSRILFEPVQITGSGRTDAGVHASGQTANFHTESEIAPEELMYLLNIKLPDDIRITQLYGVSKEFHSRYSAKSKTYEYHIDHLEKANVFTRKYTCHHPEPLDLDKMREGASFLAGKHDFKAYSSVMKGDRGTIREINQILILNNIKNEKPVKNETVIKISADGFLYHMVRIIAGTLIEVGEGKKKPEDVRKALESRNRQLAGKTAQSQGLILTEVYYNKKYSL